ncbi:MAG: ACT domain-containing protein [Acidimicrobiia bacterium]
MKEFSVRLANRPGMLASLAQTLADANVNIEALAAFGFDEEGIVRLIVDDAEIARRALREAGLRATEREVLTTVLEDRPGSLAKMARELADAGVNIDAVYLLRTNSTGLEFAVAVDETELARERLAG